MKKHRHMFTSINIHISVHCQSNEIFIILSCDPKRKFSKKLILGEVLQWSRSALRLRADRLAPRHGKVKQELDALLKASTGAHAP